MIAHPDSPRDDLRWRAWSVPYDAIEWLNADSEWRDESLSHLADLAYEEERWWRTYVDELAARFLESRDGAVELRTGAVAQLPLAIRRLIKRKRSKS